MDMSVVLSERWPISVAASGLLLVQELSRPLRRAGCPIRPENVRVGVVLVVVKSVGLYMSEIALSSIVMSCVDAREENLRIWEFWVVKCS